MRISTWNINGIRSGIRSGFAEWLTASRNDLVCLQEVKTQGDLLAASWFDGFETQWNFASRSGYSGVATLVGPTLQLISSISGIGDDLTDTEGRVLTTEFKNFIVVNTYAPHSHRLLKRLDHKRSFSKAFLGFVRKLKKSGKPIIIVGDLNVAHEEIDLTNFKANRNNAGFLPEERHWLTDILNEGFVDAFRKFEKNTGHYTWWSPISGVREKNIGWRLDYILVDEKILSCLEACFHSPNQFGSDHCPVTAVLNI